MDSGGSGNGRPALTARLGDSVGSVVACSHVPGVPNTRNRKPAANNQSISRVDFSWTQPSLERKENLHHDPLDLLHQRPRNPEPRLGLRYELGRDPDGLETQAVAHLRGWAYRSRQCSGDGLWRIPRWGTCEAASPIARSVNPGVGLHSQVTRDADNQGTRGQPRFIPSKLISIATSSYLEGSGGSTHRRDPVSYAPVI